MQGSDVNFVSISSHYLSHTKHPWQNVKNTVICKLCNFENDMYAEIIKHKVEKHKPDPFKCQHCSMEFIS